MDDLMMALRSAAQTELFAGGVALTVLGTLLALCRSIPGRVLRLLRRQFVVSVEIRDTEVAFEWMSRFLIAHPSMRGARSLTVGSRMDMGSGCAGPGPQRIGEPSKPIVEFSPAPGTYLIREGNRPVVLVRERHEGGNGGGGFPAPPRDTYRLFCIGRKPDLIRSMLERAALLAVSAEERQVAIWTIAYDSWRVVTRIRARSLESVHLAPGQRERITADLDQFLASEEWYTERGLRWKRNHLYEGPPGSGKSSLAGALAGHYGMDLYLLNVADKSMTDERLTRSVLDVNERSIILLEDIDCVLEGRQVKGPEGGVTFAGLLAAIDSEASPRGVIFILTTNHPEKLDPALLRHGRVDLREYLGEATPEQGAKLFMHWYGDRADRELSKEFGRRGTGLPMAKLQGVLMEHRDSPATALAALPDPPRCALSAPRHQVIAACSSC